MKKYLVDANFILRFLLHDNKRQFEQVEKVLIKAKEKKIKIKLISEVVMEVEYVLRKFYKTPRAEISQKLLDLTKSDFLEVEKKFILIKSLDKYASINIDLVDILLYFQTADEGSEILSFDKDFKKLQK